MKNIFLANVARSIALNKKKAHYNITKLNVPSLWYFTDEDKTKDIINILHRLPTYSGIVLRNYCSKDRKTIIKNVLRMAKRKRRQKNKNQNKLTQALHSGKNRRDP